MDKLDSDILRVLQNDFPISENPYEILAEKLDISSEQLLSRIKQMFDQGLIRRIGTSLNSNKLGYSSTLAAVSVEEKDISQASKTIASFAEVTHSYLRDDPFNIWFTIIAVDRNRIENILNAICDKLSLDDSQILNLPVKRLFKLDARFNFKS